MSPLIPNRIEQLEAEVRALTLALNLASWDNTNLRAQLAALASSPFERVEPVPPVAVEPAIAWRCACGERSWLHRTCCASCGTPRPAPPVAPVRGQRKPGVDDVEF